MWYFQLFSRGMKYPSQLLAEAVAEFTKLPGIGEKTALRLTLHLLRQESEAALRFSEAIKRLRLEIQYCVQCHNISDSPVCHICANPHRDSSTVCLVESPRDVIAIESTGVFRGVYHVLGGIISPINGIGPEQLNIQSLIQKAATGNIKEIIMALSPTLEGDTTVFYISKKLDGAPVTITTLSRGVSFGGELEYADETTLARSITSRLPYEKYLVKNHQQPL
ncbi:MAG: recombination mediator RecR [Chitinophagales bacterium]|nr:recombination mediator RecR [Chitinophagales bacterium]